jgi:hypothetical protein
MKPLLSFAALLFTAVSFGQIELEHSYDDGLATRVQLEYSGEKYYLFKKESNELIFYNADHSWWKTILLDAPDESPFTYTRILHVSEAAINPDNNIEIAYTYDPNYPAYNAYTSIMSENGTVLIEIQNANELDVLPTGKMIARQNANPLYPGNNTSKVYDTTGLTLEHFYPDGLVYGAQLENSGHKYYSVNKLTHDLNLFNSDHSLWKTINLFAPADAVLLNVDILSETLINPDDALEVGYHYAGGTGSLTFTERIINENAAQLLEIPNGNALAVSRLPGLTDKLMASLATYTSQGYVYATTVYGLPDLSMEHAYNSTMTRTKLEVSGERYYTSSHLPDNHAMIYDEHHNWWKTIAIPIPDPSFIVTTVNDVSEHQFNNDDLVEFDYSCLGGILEADQWYGGVIREDGEELLSLYAVESFAVSEWPGADRKLLATMNPPDFEGSLFRSTKVYDLAPLATSNFTTTQPFVVAPNPTSSYFEIHSKDSSVKNLKMYNMQGVLVLDQKANVGRISVEQLPAGVYVLEIKNEKQQRSMHKITVVR